MASLYCCHRLGFVSYFWVSAIRIDLAIRSPPALVHPPLRDSNLFQLVSSDYLLVLAFLGIFGVSDPTRKGRPSDACFADVLPVETRKKFLHTDHTCLLQTALFLTIMTARLYA